MKVRKTLLFVLACMLSLVLVVPLAACNETPTDTTSVESISLSATEVTLAPNDTTRLTATVKLTDGTDGEVDEWTSSDSAVATVSRGVVAAKTPGTTVITAKAGGKSATCTVTVEDIVVEISKTELSLERGTEAQLTAAVKKAGETLDEVIEWTVVDERVAKVDSTGLVTAVGEGATTVTATRKGTNQKATCAVTVTWTKPDGYKELLYSEQNKVQPNTWAWWNDPAHYVGGVSEMIEAYYQSSTESDAGRVNFTFSITDRDGDPVNREIIQITYRNADGDSEGTLHTNHRYKFSFTFISNVAGKIGVNTVGLKKEDGSVDFETNMLDVVVGENELYVEFDHGDWGTIHPNGNYNNVPSAAYFQLGLLGEYGEIVNVSIDKCKWEDLGEATVKTEKPDFTYRPDPSLLPDMSGVEAVALEIEEPEDDDRFTITTEDEGKTYNIKYERMVDNTYDHLEVP
ncbi:MAG: Ig domain-containing protein, partial [Clostridiales bacterium]|nr:Ig domain-containing protein [Clostridiales bacterium]